MPLEMREGIREIPATVRDFDRFIRKAINVTADDGTVTTDQIQNDSVNTEKIANQAVTLAKVEEIAADRILGRLTDAGSPQELTAAQLVALLRSENWAFTGDIGFFGTAAISQPPHITDAVTAHALNATFSDTEVEAALDALGAKINAVIALLESLGLKASV